MTAVFLKPRKLLKKVFCSSDHRKSRSHPHPRHIHAKNISEKWFSFRAKTLISKLGLTVTFLSLDSSARYRKRRVPDQTNVFHKFRQLELRLETDIQASFFNKSNINTQSSNITCLLSKFVQSGPMLRGKLVSIVRPF